MQAPFAGPLFRSPLLALALAFVGGLLLEGRLPTRLLAGIFPLACVGLLAAARGRRRLALASLAALFFAAGLARSLPAAGGEPESTAGPCGRALAAQGLPAPAAEGPALLEVEGRVSGAPALRFETVALELEVERARAARERPDEEAPPWIPAPGLLLELRMKKELRPLPGDRLRAVIALDDPPAATPVAARIAAQRLRRGIACAGSVRGGRIATLEPGAGLFPWVEAKRRSLSAYARLHLDGEGALALVPALMVGDRSEVGPEMNERFSASGLAHILSVSGLHLTLTVLGLYNVLRRLLLRFAGHLVDAPRWAALAALPFAPLYALLTGGNTPVLRAAIVAGLFLLAQALLRKVDGWSALGLAALLLLGAQPASLHEASFQLSFAACAGLLALSPGLRALIPIAKPERDAPWWRRWLEAPLEAFAVTLAATLATLPLTALHFNRVSLSSLAANVVGVPVGLVATVFCALALCAGLLWAPLMKPFLWLAAPSTRLLDATAAWFAGWPGARIPLASPSYLDAIAIWGASLALPALRRTPGRALAALIFAAVAIGAPRLLAPGESRLLVDFLPVGQGDAALLHLPEGGAVLIDTGGDLRGEKDRSHQVILPLLAERGVHSLRALILSHLHPDHVGSVPTLLRTMPVEEVWTTGRPLEGRFGAPIAEALAERGVPRRVLAQGVEPIELGGLRFEVLGPPRRYGHMDDPLFSANDGSLVLRIVHGEVRLLFPGDVEREGETALLASGADLRADLLKAPHHGSRTSSTEAFLDAVRPSHVVFCIGWRNGFGFPAQEVVERYAARGVLMRRTDHGSVRFASDGRRLLPLSAAPGGLHSL